MCAFSSGMVEIGGAILYGIVTISLAAVAYLLYVISSIFHDPYDENKKLVLDMTGTPLDVAKRYFKTNPYVAIVRGGKKVLCRDGGRDQNVCSNIQYLNEKVVETLKALNQQSRSIRIETREEFIHHVLVEISLVLFQLMDLGLDSGTNFCKKMSTPNGDTYYVTVCRLTSANVTKED
jgi:hypothetical protein